MSNWFRFTYYPFTSKDAGTGKIINILRPSIPIIISYKGSASWPFQALVDSGSDRNLFPAGPARSIGIEVENGEKIEINGIGNSKVIAYSHKVQLFIANYKFETEIDFSRDQQTPLLGREGFFNHFKKIEFKEKEKSVEFRI